MTLTPNDRSYPLCSSKQHQLLPRYSLQPWLIAACQDCAFVYLRNPVDYEQLMSEHAWEKSNKRERTRRQRERPLLNRISRATRFRFKLRKNRKNYCSMSLAREAG